MARIQLDVEYDYDFDLLGISSHARDYRLCWALNQKLGIGLAKTKDDVDHKPKKQDTVAFTLYEFYDEEDHVEYMVLANKSGNSMLIPEQKQADYLMLLRNNFVVDKEELVKKIKEIDIILTAYIIDVKTLKSKENLIF